MDSSPRTVRVFVSSTFRDMHAERDHLVTVVFPQLRQMCESRGVTWGEVDLRWGVTEEAASEGQILPICLEEIRRCRPFFIGLLGERYGWIPDRLPEDLVAEETWLADRGRNSITHLEILHGVLRDSSIARHAYFYFRNPAWVDRLPAGCNRSDFIAETLESAEKLRALKDQIRLSGRPVREGYQTPAALGELVLRDFANLIEELFPQGSEPEPRLRESLDHEAFARTRRRQYAVPDGAFPRLDQYAGSEETKPLVISGESGSGKSALLANWAEHYRSAHPGSAIFEHYVDSTPASTSWSSLVERLLYWIAARFDIKEDVPTSSVALRRAFSEWIPIVAARGRVVVIIDGIDRLDDHEGALELAWLPVALPPNVRLVCSVSPGRTHDETVRRKWPELGVPVLTPLESKALARAFLGDYGRRLSEQRLEQIVSAKSSSNPSFLTTLLNELRLFGHHDQLDRYIDELSSCASLYELWQKVLVRWESSYEGELDLVGETMSLLWAARNGLSESEILDNLGQEGRPLARRDWSPLFLAMSDVLAFRDGTLAISSAPLRDAVEELYLPTEAHQRRMNLQLAEYFARRPGPRTRQELPWQLARAEEWSQLADLLSEREFFRIEWFRQQHEILRYWKQITSHTSIDPVERHAWVEVELAQMGSIVDAVVVLFSELSMVPAAAALCRQIVSRRREAGHPTLEKALGNLAVLEGALKNTSEEIALLEEQEVLCRRDHKNLDGLASCLSNLAVTRDIDDHHRALGLLREAEGLLRQRESTYCIAALPQCILSQSVLLARSGDDGLAFERAVEAKAAARSAGQTRTVAAALQQEGVIFAGRGDTSGAHQAFEQQTAVCRTIGDPQLIADALCNDAQIYAAQPIAILQNRALSILDDAIECLRHANLPERALLRPLWLKFQVLQFLGDHESARYTQSLIDDILLAEIADDLPEASVKPLVANLLFIDSDLSKAVLNNDRRTGSSGAAIPESQAASHAAPSADLSTPAPSDLYSDVTCCAFNRDATLLVVSSCDQKLKLWDLQGRSLLATLRGHTQHVISCAFSPDGRSILSTSWDGTMRLWDASTGTPLAVLTGHTQQIQMSAFSPDGRYVVSVSMDSTMRVWDGVDGHEVGRIGAHARGINACAISPDCSRIATGGGDGTVALWDLHRGAQLGVLQAHRGPLTLCAFSPDGKALMSLSWSVRSVGYDETLRLWDVASGRLLATLNGHSDLINHAEFSPDGTLIASACRDTMVGLWDARNGRALAALKGHLQPVSTCHFSPNGELVVSAGDDHELRIWDTRARTLMEVLSGHNERVKACAFDSSGTRLASGDADGQVRLWTRECNGWVGANL